MPTPEEVQFEANMKLLLSVPFEGSAVSYSPLMRCATHTSVIRTMRGEIAAPQWIAYALKGTDFAQAYPNMSPAQLEAMARGYKVISLHPCADGTLTISVSDPWNIWTANYEVNLKEQRIDTGSWVERGGGMMEIQKMPIPGWSLYTSLKANLDSLAVPVA